MAPVAGRRSFLGTVETPEITLSRFGVLCCVQTSFARRLPRMALLSGAYLVTTTICSGTSRPVSERPQPTTPNDQADLRLLEPFCRVVAPTKPGDPVACAECPPFTAVAQFQGSGGGTIGAIYRGSFSRAGADEALVTLDGCEAHGDNYGGMVLVGHDSTGWRFVSYFAGAHNECKATERDGRTLLLCSDVDYSQGVETQTLSEEDYGVAAASQLLLRAVDVMGGLCTWPDSQDSGRARFRVAKLLDYGWSDLNGDGIADVTARVQYSSEALEPDVSSDSCRDELEVLRARLESSPTTAAMDFVATAGKYAPIGETRRLLKYFE
jgi:hypothetical protein